VCRKERPSLYDLIEEMKRLAVPTLIVTGDEDWPCLLPGILMKQSIPSAAALAVIPNSGHAINIEEPDEYNRIVGDFLRRWKPAAGRNETPSGAPNTHGRRGKRVTNDGANVTFVRRERSTCAPKQRRRRQQSVRPTRLIRQHGLDGNPFTISEFVAHDSSPVWEFESQGSGQSQHFGLSSGPHSRKWLIALRPPSGGR
jgi:hypothetical protein